MLTAMCSACQRTRQRRTLCYDTQFKGYCMNICSPEHPNSPMNLKKRGQYAELMSYNDAAETLTDRANKMYRTGAESANKRQRAGVTTDAIITDTISFRIREEAHSEYIMYIMGKEGFNKVSQAMHTIMNMAILADQGFMKHAAGMSNLQHVPVRDHIENKLQSEKPAPVQQDEEVFEL